MVPRKAFLAVLIACVSAASARASALAFQIIQHDQSVDEVRASSLIMENTLFDYFFGKGFITTNSPTAISGDSYKDRQIAYGSLGEAKAGGCSYFVVISVDYDVKGSANPASTLLTNIRRISWDIYDVAAEAVIYSTAKTIGKVSERRNNERGIIAVCREMAADIYQHVDDRW